MGEWREGEILGLYEADQESSSHGSWLFLLLIRAWTSMGQVSFSPRGPEFKGTPETAKMNPILMQYFTKSKPVQKSPCFLQNCHPR